MHPVEAIVAATLILWFGLTVLEQLKPRWFERIQARDLFGLLPQWTFFAPNPGHSDYHVVFRDRLDSGLTSSWSELTTLEQRRPYSFLWNPSKRASKVIADAAAMLAGGGADQLDDGAVMLSLPYLILLNLVLATDGDPRSARQFALLETFGNQGPRSMRVLLVSDFHALSESAA